MVMVGSRIGVKHWIFQRVSNALIVIFGIALAITLASGVSYESLQALMGNMLVKLYLAVTLVFAAGNSILAGWQIAGDYAKKFHINHSLMVGVTVVVSLAYLVIGSAIIF